jgi:hypothetical protein
MGDNLVFTRRRTPGIVGSCSIHQISAVWIVARTHLLYILLVYRMFLMNHFRQHQLRRSFPPASSCLLP